jgi:hypothetical protein
VDVPKRVWLTGGGHVRRGTAGLKTPDTIAWIIDVDPVEML